jgi:hypothetical protein
MWSGWGSTSTLPPQYALQLPNGWGGRLVSGIDFLRLRLFLQSLLWRAAATERWEISEVTLPPDDLEVLSVAVLHGSATPLQFYPATLLQISTRGPAQNMVPLAQMVTVPNLPGLGARRRPIFRFYFDGLVVHFHRQASGSIDGMRSSVVGAKDTLLVGSGPLPTRHHSSAKIWRMFCARAWGRAHRCRRRAAARCRASASAGEQCRCGRPVLHSARFA